jgi:hypothetical protein
MDVTLHFIIRPTLPTRAVQKDQMAVLLPHAFCCTRQWTMAERSVQLFRWPRLVVKALLKLNLRETWTRQQVQIRLC